MAGPPLALLALGLEWAELDLFRETLSASFHTAEKHVGTLEFFSAFSHSQRKPTYVECETSQMTYLAENKSTSSDVRQSKTDGAVDRSQTSCWPWYDHIFMWCSAPRGVTQPVRSRPDFWRNELLYRANDIETHPSQKTSTSFAKTGRPNTEHTAHDCAIR